MRSQSESFFILERALDAANADEADATFLSTDQNISRFANSSVHQNMSEISAELTLRVFSGGAMGSASTTSFEPEDLARAASLALQSARHSDALHDFTGLPRQNDPVAPLVTFDEQVASLPPAAKALALRGMFDAGSAAGVHYAGSFRTAVTSVACANTHGLRRYATMTAADAAAIATGSAGSGYATDVSRGMLDIPAIGREALRRATLRSGTQASIGSGPIDVILEPAATGELLEWLDMIAFSGSAFEDGSSFFVGNIGKKLLSSNLIIADDAIDPHFLPFPFDLEGLPKRRVALIEGGVIRTPVVDKAWADRLKIAPTANAWSLGSTEHGHALHLSVDAGNATREELIASTRRGVWVTRFNYVNGLLEPRNATMTGTTRDGTFLIENGEVVARLPNLRWTQSIVEAFGRIEGLTSDRRRSASWFNDFGGTIAPVMKIAGWHFD